MHLHETFISVIERIRRSGLYAPQYLSALREAEGERWRCMSEQPLTSGMCLEMGEFVDKYGSADEAHQWFAEAWHLDHCNAAAAERYADSCIDRDQREVAISVSKEVVDSGRRNGDSKNLASALVFHARTCTSIDSHSYSSEAVESLNEAVMLLRFLAWDQQIQVGWWFLDVLGKLATLQTTYGDAVAGAKHDEEFRELHARLVEQGMRSMLPVDVVEKADVNSVIDSDGAC